MGHAELGPGAGGELRLLLRGELRGALRREPLEPHLAPGAVALDLGRVRPGAAGRLGHVLLLLGGVGRLAPDALAALSHRLERGPVLARDLGRREPLRLEELAALLDDLEVRGAGSPLALGEGFRRRRRLPGARGREDEGGGDGDGPAHRNLRSVEEQAFYHGRPDRPGPSAPPPGRRRRQRRGSRARLTVPGWGGRSDRVTQAERLARREQLRADIAKRELDLEQMRAEESRLLEGCEHLYADGRGAATGGRVKICSNLRPPPEGPRREAVGLTPTARAFGREPERETFSFEETPGDRDRVLTSAVSVITAARTAFSVRRLPGPSPSPSPGPGPGPGPAVQVQVADPHRRSALPAARPRSPSAVSLVTAARTGALL